MPVKLRVDTSSSTDQETGNFLKEHHELFRSASAEVEFKSQGAFAPPAPSQTDVYKEMMQSIRQYGTIRYILFPLYLTLTAVLAAAYYKGEYKVPSNLLLSAGVASSLAWLIFEYALSESLRTTWNEVAKVVGGSKVFASDVNPMAHRAPHITVPPRIVFYAVYGCGILFWVAVLFNICPYLIKK